MLNINVSYGSCRVPHFLLTQSSLLGFDHIWQIRLLEKITKHRNLTNCIIVQLLYKIYIFRSIFINSGSLNQPIFIKFGHYWQVRLQFILKYSQDLTLHGITPKPQHETGERRKTHGYRKCGTHARVFSRPLAHVNSKNKTRQRHRSRR